MMKKIITPKQHGYLDWGFVAGLLVIPKLLKVNPDAQKFYSALACNVVAVNGTTDHKAGLVPLISVKTHEKLDYANLALLYGMLTTKTIRKDKAALDFHIGLTALATINVLSTDYDMKSFKDISK